MRPGADRREPAFVHALVLVLGLTAGGCATNGAPPPPPSARPAAPAAAVPPLATRAGAALVAAAAPASLPVAAGVRAPAGALAARVARRVLAREALVRRCRLEPYVAFAHPALVGGALRAVGVDDGAVRTVTGALGRVDRAAAADLSRELCALVTGAPDGPGRPRLARLHDALRRLGGDAGALDPLVGRLVDLAATGREPTALDAAGATADLLHALDVAPDTAAAAGAAVGLGLWLLGAAEPAPPSAPDAGPTGE